MLICVIFDLGMAVIMFLFGICFVKSNGKAAAFLAGYQIKKTKHNSKTYYVWLGQLVIFLSLLMVVLYYIFLYSETIFYIIFYFNIYISTIINFSDIFKA